MQMEHFLYRRVGVYFICRISGIMTLLFLSLLELTLLSPCPCFSSISFAPATLELFFNPHDLDYSVKKETPPTAEHEANGLERYPYSF